MTGGFIVFGNKPVHFKDRLKFITTEYKLPYDCCKVKVNGKEIIRVTIYMDERLIYIKELNGDNEKLEQRIRSCFDIAIKVEIKYSAKKSAI